MSTQPPTKPSDERHLLMWVLRGVLVIAGVGAAVLALAGRLGG
jgi:hypothetical protein